MLNFTGIKERAIFIQIESGFVSEKTGCMGNSRKEIFMLKCVKGIVVNKILQGRLRWQLVFEFMQRFLFMESAMIGFHWVIAFSWFMPVFTHSGGRKIIR